VAFLPLTGAAMITSIVGMTRRQGRFGPRPLVVAGMACGAIGMLILTRLDIHARYATLILPATLVMGVGVGLVFSTALSNATLGVVPSDTGVASAAVTASQQVGGSIGTALLSTIVAGAASGYLGHRPPSAGLAAHAAVHGYTTGFAWAAVIFAIGAAMAATLFTGVQQATRPSPDAVLAQ
jgi:MFS family permease